MGALSCATARHGDDVSVRGQCRTRHCRSLVHAANRVVYDERVHATTRRRWPHIRVLIFAFAFAACVPQVTAISPTVTTDGDLAAKDEEMDKALKGNDAIVLVGYAGTSPLAFFENRYARYWPSVHSPEGVQSVVEGKPVTVYVLAYRVPVGTLFSLNKLKVRNPNASAKFKSPKLRLQKPGIYLYGTIILRGQAGRLFPATAHSKVNTHLVKLAMLTLPQLFERLAPVNFDVTKGSRTASQDPVEPDAAESTVALRPEQNRWQGPGTFDGVHDTLSLLTNTGLGKGGDDLVAGTGMVGPDLPAGDAITVAVGPSFIPLFRGRHLLNVVGTVGIRSMAGDGDRKVFGYTATASARYGYQFADRLKALVGGGADLHFGTKLSDGPLSVDLDTALGMFGELGIDWTVQRRIGIEAAFRLSRIRYSADGMSGTVSGNSAAIMFGVRYTLRTSLPRFD